MSSQAEIVELLNQQDASCKLQKLSHTTDKFEVLEILRRLSLDSLHLRRHNISTRSLRLVEEESAAILSQYQRLEDVLSHLLAQEGRRSALDNYVRLDDPDLPTDPSLFSDPTFAFQYMLKRIYRRQFEVAVNEQKDGGWPLLMADLLDPLDGKRVLFIEAAPEAWQQHSSAEFAKDLDLARVEQLAKIFHEMELGFAVRMAHAISSENEITRSKFKTAKEVLMKLLDWASRTTAGIEIYREYRKAVEAAKEAAAKFLEQQKAKRAWKEAFGNDGPRAIEGSSDHCDQFDKNRDIIERTC